MGHEYVKESETFNVNRNGTVPKPSQAEIEAGKVLKADGTWGEGGGGGTGDVEDVYVNGASVLDEDKIAQITSYKEVTQSEYNALPDSKNSDNVLYCIKDAPSSTEGFPPLIYSTEEREIGVWADGKPLYQKTWKCTLPAISGSTTGEYVSLINLPNVSVKRVEAYEANGASVYPFTGYSGSKGTQLVNFRYLEGYIKLYDIGVPYSAGEVITVTVKYTKNADVAGSGTWTTQGALAHHYSTSEKVVGTWIDGKPLYEKTIIKAYNELSNNGIRKILDLREGDTTKVIQTVSAFALSPTYGRCYLGCNAYDSNTANSTYFSLHAYYNTLAVETSLKTLASLDYYSPSIQAVVQYTKTTD